MTKNYHWIYFVGYAILFVFMGVMTHVTYTAFSRSSGSTGQDILQIQKTRFEAFQYKKGESK